MKSNIQADNVSVKSKQGSTIKKGFNKPIQPIKQDQKSQGSGNSKKNPPDYITPTPGEQVPSQENMKKTIDKIPEKKILATIKKSRFLPLEKNQIKNENDDIDQELQQHEEALLILDEVRINNYNVPRYLKKDGGEEKGTGKHVRHVRRLHREKKIKELKSKIEEYQVPPKTKVYREKSYYDDLKRKYQKVKDSLNQSEASFAEEQDNPADQFHYICNYQISAFLPSDFISSAQDMNNYISPRMSHIQSDQVNRSSDIQQSKEFYMEFKDKQSLLNDSVQPFQQPVQQVKVVIPGDVEQILENDNDEDDLDFAIDREQAKAKGIRISSIPQKNIKSAQEQGSFPSPALDYLQLQKIKPRYSQVLDMALNKEGIQNFQDELFPYNQQKISELAKEIFSSPPFLNNLINTNLISIDIYANNGCSVESLQVYISESPISKIRAIYIQLLTIMQEFKTVKVFLGEQCVLISNQINESKTQLDSLSKEVAKFSIQCTKQEILNTNKCQDYLQSIHQLNNRMDINLQKITVILSEIECNEAQKDEMIFEQFLNYCKEKIKEALKEFNSFNQIFTNYMCNAVQASRFNDYLNMRVNGSVDLRYYQQEAELAQFIISFPQMVKNKIEESKLFVWFCYKFLLNQQEIQDEQVRIGRNLLENFSNGYTSIQILYDFSVIKYQKINIKLKAICASLNGIRLPYREYQDFNDSIISEYLRSLKKLKSRDKTLLPSLLELSFTPELIEQISTLAGKHRILQEYIGYRNSVIKNPRKFNFSLILNRPMLLLQKMKELNLIEKSLEGQFYQMELIEGMYKFFTKIPVFEEELASSQDIMRQVRDHIQKTDNQMIIRTQISDLQQQLIRLLQIKDTLPLFKGFVNKKGLILGLQEEILLPQQITRIKEWVGVGIEQCQHLQHFLFDGLKFELENLEIVKEQEQRLAEHTSRGLKLMDLIKLIIQVEASPTIINYIKMKSLQPKQKQLQMVQPLLTSQLSKDQEVALQQIYSKYLDEVSEQQVQEDEKQKLQIQKFRVIEQCDHILNELISMKDSTFISAQKKLEISASYLQLAEMSQKYQIWEHMVATRYIMDPTNLTEVIKGQQLFPEKSTTAFPSYSVDVLIRKIKEHISFFDINLNNQQSQYYRKHLGDGNLFFTMIKQNFDSYKEKTEQNIASPGTVQIEPTMTELQQKVDKFFKQKTTLSFMKDDLIKAIKYYIQQNTIQFKNSGKAATLNTKFEDIKPVVLSIEKLLEEGSKLIQIIYQKGFLEAIQDMEQNLSFKEDLEEGRKLSLDEMLSKTDFSLQFNQAKEQISINYEFMRDFREKNDLKQMPTHENMLTEQIQLFSEITTYIDIFEKTLQVAYDNSYDLIEDLKVVMKKQNFFLEGFQKTSNDYEDVNQKELLSFIKDLALRLVKNAKILKEVSSQSPVKKESENKDKKATEPLPTKALGRQVTNAKPQLYIVKFKKGRVVDEACYISLKIAKQTIDLLENIYAISYQFLEIDAGFMKYDHEIELQKADFFDTINLWIFFFTGRDRPNLKLPEGTKPLSQIIPICQDRLKNLPKLSQKIYDFLKQAVDSLIQTVTTYQSYLNKDFMIALSEFGNKFHVGDDKVQDFQTFVDDLQYALTPKQDNKEGVKMALQTFFEKNKRSEDPLRRMSQFYKTLIKIKSDNRMQKQHILKKIRDITILHEKMGGQRGESWIKLCQNMQSCLQNYFQDVEAAQLKNYKHYTQKIQENASNDEDKDLKKLVEQFVKLIEKDHELSKVYNK